MLSSPESPSILHPVPLHMLLEMLPHSPDPLFKWQLIVLDMIFSQKPLTFHFIPLSWRLLNHDS